MRAGLKTVQRCKSERSSCAKVQKWRDGVAGDTLARGHVGKGRLQIGGLVDQRLGGSDEANSRINSKGNRRPEDWLGWLEVGTAPRAVLVREA